jgi:hypothetical protein
MGVQSPTGFELLRDDKAAQNHWARRLIAFVIDAVIVTVVLAIIAVVGSIPFLIGLSFPSTTVGAFPAGWNAWWGAWLGGLIPFLVFLYFFLAEGLYGRTLGKEIMVCGYRESMESQWTCAVVSLGTSARSTGSYSS